MPIGYKQLATFMHAFRNIYDYNLRPGDRIFLYTDDLVEAKRSDGERYGIDRMLSVLNDNKEKRKSRTDKPLEAKC